MSHHVSWKPSSDQLSFRQETRTFGALWCRNIAEAGQRFQTCFNKPCCVPLQVPAAAQQLTQVLSKLRHTFVVADATLPDCPLVYASES